MIPLRSENIAPRETTRSLEITDKINITLSKNEQTDDAVVAFKDYICNQVLGASLVLADSVQDGVKLDMDEYELELKIDKI